MQLIALIYKDQHVHTLQSLLALWLDTELSDSSESNESNTSPQDQNGSCSSPVTSGSAETDSSSSDGINQSGQYENQGGDNKEDSCPADASSTDSGNDTPAPNKHHYHVAVDTVNNSVTSTRLDKGSSNSNAAAAGGGGGSANQKSGKIASAIRGAADTAESSSGRGTSIGGTENEEENYLDNQSDISESSKEVRSHAVPFIIV